MKLKHFSYTNMQSKALLLAVPLALMLCVLNACSDTVNAPSEVLNNDEQSSKKLSKQLNDHVELTDSKTDWSVVPLPDISRQPVQLSVASVVNSRFKQLTDSQIKQILLTSQLMVKKFFDIDIEFSETEVISIEETFNYLDPSVIAQRKSEIVDTDFIDAAAKSKAREEMQQALYATLSNYSGNEQSVINYAQPYLLNPDEKQKDFIGLSYALIDTLLERLNYWQLQKADDGKPVLNHNGYHQWVWWDSLGYSKMPYDVLITNQLVASAEYYAMDVHSSMRGGITAGTTTYSKYASLNSYVYIMVYPMLNDTTLLETLRGDESYSTEQIINYSAALLTHELGHMLLHLGHPFGNKACIMSPTVMLNYRDWVENLDAELCAVGSSQDMKPGAANLDYNRSW